MKKLFIPLVFAALAFGCGGDVPTDADVPSADFAVAMHPAPGPLITENLFGVEHTFWPYTDQDYEGTKQDPLNLLFVGNTDPRMLRAALMFLDGDRTPFFPSGEPFDCTWKDAIGGNQVAYGLPAGWVGNGVQLECGDYGPIRFHVRFFDAGGWTLGNGHFEFLVPGTPDHRVLSWELGEQIAWVDFLRTGLVYPGNPVGTPTVVPINEVPFNYLDAAIFNLLPDDLKFLMTGSTDPAAEPVPIPTSGNATVINVLSSTATPAGMAQQRFTLQFDQTIPKPFCSSSPFDFLYVNGPIDLRQQVHMTPSGNLVSQFHANGKLSLTPVNPITGEPTGPTYKGHVNEHHKNIVTDNVTLVSQLVIQVEIPSKGPNRGRIYFKLNVGPGSADHAVDIERCDP
jgi:hypothetical protein